MQGPLADDLRAAGVPVAVRELAVLRRELLSPGGLGRLARAFGGDARALPRLDAVHANTSVILGGWALRGVPHVVHVREIYSGWGPLWSPYRALLRRADGLVCVSEAVRAPIGKGVVVHDGLAAAPQLPPRAHARAALGIGDDGLLTCAVLGRISAWKGQALLARALAEVPGVLGLCAGDAWPGQEHHERALRMAAAPLGERWRMLGFVEDPSWVLAAADVVVVPSTLPDPFPNSALEAAAAGCCVVAAAHGGLPEMLRDGVTGRLVAPGDAAALAQVLRELRDDPEQRARLGAAAARDVAQRFGVDRMVRGVEDAWHQVIERR